ncbi:MAG: hypothetical protein R3E77_10250 [Steroidobacteraceae bacterium]
MQWPATKLPDSVTVQHCGTTQILPTGSAGVVVDSVNFRCEGLATVVIRWPDGHQVACPAVYVTSSPKTLWFDFVTDTNACRLRGESFKER